MSMFRCEKCGKEFPLPHVYDGWKYGEPMVCQKCMDAVKDDPPRK